MCEIDQLYDFIFCFLLRKPELYRQHMNTHSNKLFLLLDRFRADSFPFAVIIQGVSTQPIHWLKILYTPTLITLSPSLQITVKLTRPVNPGPFYKDTVVFCTPNNNKSADKQPSRLTSNFRKHHFKNFTALRSTCVFS